MQFAISSFFIDLHLVLIAIIYATRDSALTRQWSFTVYMMWTSVFYCGELVINISWTEHKFTTRMKCSITFITCLIHQTEVNNYQENTSCSGNICCHVHPRQSGRQISTHLSCNYI